MTPSTPVNVRFRKLAVDDGLDERLRVKRWDPDTGVVSLVHVLTGEPFPRPPAGVVFDMDETPTAIVITPKYVGAESWIETVNARPVHKPAGPAEDPWRATHTFVHVDEIVLHLADGDRRYRVVRQPDKYDAAGEPTDVAGDPDTYVDNVYVAELIEEA